MRLLTSALLISIFFCSCNKTWQYRANSIKKAAVLNESVTVLPFQDRRPKQNSDLATLCIVPLLPYGWQNLDLPEMAFPGHMNTGIWFYNPKEDFAEALAEELNEAGVFKKVLFSDYGSKE